MEKIHIVLTVVVVLLCASIAYIAYDRTRGAEVEISEEGAPGQLPTPPKPTEEAPSEIALAQSIYAQGEAGEEISGTIIYIDYQNFVIYFEETETGEIYYTLIDEFSELKANGRPATLVNFYEGMPITVRWTDEPLEEAGE